MEFKIQKEQVLPLLSQIQSILEKRSSLPVFSNILIQIESKNQARMYASDSELSFSTYIPIQSEKGEGSIALNGKKFFEIVRELKDGVFKVKCSTSSQKIQISQGTSQFKIHGLNPDEFPSFPDLKKENKQSLTISQALDMIEKTLYCVSLDESRYHLTGVFLEKVSSGLRFVATDGHRMSFLDIEGKGDHEEIKKGIIIPKKGLQELKKILSLGEGKDTLDFYIEKPRLLVVFKNQNLNIRLIEGQYPNYKSLISKTGGSEILINRENFLSALKRISVLTTNRLKGVNFTFTKKKLNIFFSHPEVGEAFEELECDYNGAELKTRFNSRYVIDILQSFHEKNLKFILKDNMSAGLIQPEGNKRYNCLVMPMKI